MLSPTIILKNKIMDTLFIYWYSYSIIVSSLKPLAMLSHLTQLTIWNYSIFVIHLELNYICTILNNNESIVSLSCYYKPLAINKTNLYLVPCFITCWNLNIVSLKEIFCLKRRLIPAKKLVSLNCLFLRVGH